MNDLRNKIALLITGMLVVAGCNIDSGNDTVREVGVNFSGLYSNNGGRIVSSNSGNGINTLNLSQSGDNLTATDNNGNIFRGSIGQVVESRATFNLRGPTTAGNTGTISGNIFASGTTATMAGTWVEPALFGNVSASASIVGATTTNTNNVDVVDDTNTNTNTNTVTNP